jgi:UDP-glucose 4-epimerase
LKLRNKNILITGAAGFIGSYLVEKLYKDNFIIGIDNFSTGKSWRVDKFVGENFKLFNCDINKIHTLEIGEIEYIFHCAAELGVVRAYNNPLGVLETDVIGVSNLLKYSVKKGVKRFIFASSSEVYGEPSKLPLVEEDNPSPKSVYGVAKLCAERFCKAYSEVYGLETVILRYFNIYGPKQDTRFVVSRFISQLILNKPPVIYGDGNQTRNFCYIEDAVEATILAGTVKEAKNNIFNIAGKELVTIRDLAYYLIRISGLKFKPKFVPLSKSKRPQKYEIKFRFGSIENAQKILEFEPKIDLITGLKKTFEFYRKNPQALVTVR